MLLCFAELYKSKRLGVFLHYALYILHSTFYIAIVFIRLKCYTQINYNTKRGV